MWVEIYDKDAKIAFTPPTNISPQPNSDYEFRVIIWKTKNVDIMDFEGTSDV